MIMLIELNTRFLKSSVFRLMIENRIEQIFKRRKKILNLKTFKEKLTSNLRIEDYKTYEMELTHLYNELENLKQLQKDIDNFNQ